VTPKLETYTGVDPYWATWYYQFKKSGYEDSKIIFKSEGAVNKSRYVHATLKPKPSSDWPKSVYQNEADFRKLFDVLSDLEPIEGIWNYNESGTWRNIKSGESRIIPSSNKYRIAIIRDKTRPNYQFQVVILESVNPRWKPGFIKAYFRKTAYSGVYEGLWYLADYSERRENYVVDENGLIEIQGTFYDSRDHNIELNYKGTFIKAYPPFRANISTQILNNLPKSGSGTILSSNGLIVTNYHVVENAKRIEVILPKSKVVLESKIRIRDSQNDIAILGIENLPPQSIFKRTIPFNIIDATDVKIGQTVFTLGFPLSEIMGSTPRLSTGRINSRLGIQDDPRLFQISNPLQPGNSGGPLFNEKGELIGIVVSGLNAKFLYEQAGIIPQNVNFAIKSIYLKNLISMLPNADEILKTIAFR
jgi:hypothetical protein